VYDSQNFLHLSKILFDIVLPSPSAQEYPVTKEKGISKQRNVR
jgi:hypothetical protein